MEDITYSYPRHHLYSSFHSSLFVVLFYCLVFGLVDLRLLEAVEIPIFLFNNETTRFGYRRGRKIVLDTHKNKTKVGNKYECITLIYPNHKRLYTILNRIDTFISEGREKKNNR